MSDLGIFMGDFERYRGRQHVSAGKLRKRLEEITNDFKNSAAYIQQAIKDVRFHDFKEKYLSEHPEFSGNADELNFVAFVSGVFSNDCYSCDEIPEPIIDSIKRLNGYANKSTGNHVDGVQYSRKGKKEKVKKHKRSGFNNFLADSAALLENVVEMTEELKEVPDKIMVSLYRCKGVYHVEVTQTELMQNYDSLSTHAVELAGDFNGEGHLDVGVQEIFVEAQNERNIPSYLRRKYMDNELHSTNNVKVSSAMAKGDEQELETALLQRKWDQKGNKPIYGKN